MASFVDPRFGVALREFRERRGLSLRSLGQLAHRSKSHLHELETGLKAPTVDTARHLDRILDAGGVLARLIDAPIDHAAEAGELRARVVASDVSKDVLGRIEQGVDDLASAYPTMAPADLLPLVRRHLAYVGRLLDGRVTLAQQRRLLVAGGWLAVLRATVHIDLRQRSAAAAHLRAGHDLAEHAEHAEIRAWCLETRAWDVLTQGDYRAALDLSRQAQRVAPKGSSAYIQATAQEARAWARMGDVGATRRALDRVERLAANLPVPERAEHHYRYDPAKAAAYTATTLSWAGDPGAEQVARAVLADLDPDGDGGARPRRSASARLDLGLALVAAGQSDEAVALGAKAVASGRVVPSNWWRATELLAKVEQAGVPEAATLRDLCIEFAPGRRPSADSTSG
ncbi:Helix-turn-helix domain-containing protein [Micromonospora purpureochromogenes]|uniref:Helix-turn-helix domain-containing protein n=1 Tax=Micromonospora purpureochromogenes TaxID=47872 RepID=A0A1C4ZKP8_9ACTN|nr:helix-turn-helix transcriptional regulator [Micromonospora purpureochromogenes]SCF33518.1 Helix-turn-helix domain-containing protein [Micromonospora purpureochromogenes]